MDNKSLNIFKNKISEKLKDNAWQDNFNENINNYEQNLNKSINEYKDLEFCRERLYYIKKHTLNDLEKYLISFESKFIRSGGTVYWADDANDVAKILEEIIPEDHGLILKTKSNTCNEININQILLDKKYKFTETSFAEFLLHEKNEKPSHLANSIQHLSKKEIILFFEKQFKTKNDASPEEILNFFRNELKPKYKNANIGITGANFLVADSGSVVISENEGNVANVISSIKKHIIIAGIDKIIPSIKDLYLFLPMLATYSTGQKISVFNHIISGAARSSELDGCNEVIIILINNNRHNLLENVELRESLNCIQCGACLNNCPVFSKISAQVFPSVYHGPIGSIVAPHLQNTENLFFLSYNSVLCGKCTEHCPVKIKLHDLIVYNRHLSVENKNLSAIEMKLMRRILKQLKTRKSMNFYSAKIKNIALKIYLRKSYNRYKEPLIFAEKSFNIMMKDKNSE